MNVFDIVANLTIDTSEYDSGLKDALRAAENFGSNAEKELGQSADGMEKSMSDSAEGIADSIGSAAESVGDSAGEMSKSADDFSTAVESGAEGVSSSMSDMADDVDASADSFASAVESGANSVATSMDSMEDSAGSAASSFAGSMSEVEDSAGSAADFFAESSMSMTESAEAFADSIASATDSVYASMDGISDSSGSASDNFISAMENVAGSMDTTSDNIADGASSGISSLFNLMSSAGSLSSQFGSLGSAAKNMSKTLIDALKTPAGAAVALAAAITGITVALVKGASATADYGDHIDKMSQKIGISAEAYQKWDYVMNLAGTDVDNLKMGLKTMSSQATKGAEEFKKLGISTKELKTLSKEDLFYRVVDGLSQMEDGTKRSALATKLLGRAGVEMAPLFNMGSEAIKEQIKTAEDYGMIMSDEMVKASAAYVDSGATLKMTVGGVKNALLGQLIPSMTKTRNGLAKLFAGNGEGAVEFFQGIGGFIKEAILMIPEAIGGFAKGLGQAAVAIAKALGTAIIEKVPELFNNLINWLDGAIAKLEEWEPGEGDLDYAGFTILQKLGQAIIKYVPIVVKALAKLGLKISKALLKLAPRLFKLGGTLLLKLLKGMVGKTGELLSWLGTLLEDMLTKLGSKSAEFAKKGRQFVAKILSGIGEKISQIPAKMGELASSAIEKLRQWLDFFKTKGKQIVDRIKSGITDKFWECVNKIGDLAQAMWDKLTGWLPDFRNIGKNIMDGIKGGINDNKESVAKAASSAGKYAYDKTRKLLGINSPSKLFAKGVGASIPEGTAKGIVDNFGFIESALTDMRDMMNVEFEPSVDYSLRTNGARLIDSGYGDGQYETAESQITFNIYPRESQDEQAIAKYVQKELVRWEKQKRRAFA